MCKNSLLNLTLSHMLIVVHRDAGSNDRGGKPRDFWLTRPAGAEFLPLFADDQQYRADPSRRWPVAGDSLYRCWASVRPPTLGWRYFLYGLLPIFRECADRAHDDFARNRGIGARGTGMTEQQRLLQIELPLALPLILAGHQAVGGDFRSAPRPSVRRWRRGTLGEAIIAGLINNNLAFVAPGRIGGGRSGDPDL